MNRPIYETEADRHNQMTVADTMAKILGKRLIKTRHLSAADYVVEDATGTATGLMEIKVRRYTAEELDAMGGFFLSERKLILVYKTVRLLKMDFHLVVKTPNCLLHLEFWDGIPWPILERKFGGRFDRGDHKDAETLCLFPTTMFTRIDDEPAPVSTGGP